MIWLALILAVIVTLAAHEAGHALAAQAWRLPWRPTLTWHGPGIRIGSDDIKLTRSQIATTCAAGPAANLLVAVVAVFVLHMPLVALLNIEFAVVNLLPFPRSDGRNILGAVRA